ncbi:endonuclease/exonuclease/phosphatase family protein [Planctomicrobium piriforme]|uniref:Metal-dependent hydrolase, endonuclease/exonuclease/phosphatase family n=1 Tax=Planctomicrobium piriforme TaxID=1576369 RepID=A0A1I3GTX3_9PLAN|nr:endonuclease/exonuclease/phosphatase family protein [Planctomicrobium piriforme]SFI26752.1 Metal-dependent hydrolase, endonuclease/exonuclease/phosphatase family [Planctomicrobium piriforme]
MADSTEKESSPPVAARERGWRRWLRRGVWFAANAVPVVLLLGLLIRLTVKDVRLGVGLIFYMTPLPILVFGAAACLLWSLIHRWWIRSVAWGVLLVLLVPWWWAHDWRSNPTPPAASAVEPAPVKVLFWNVARRADLAETLKFIAQVDADIVGLVELEGSVEERRKELRAALPHYDVSVLGSNMYVLAKGPSGETAATELDGDSVARQLQVTIRGQSCQVVLVDIDSGLQHSRRKAMHALADLCLPYSDQPVLVMGDFNLPSDSVHYENLRKQFRLLFDVVGNGYAPTWPVPCPVMQLDQIWFNSHVVPLACQHLTSFASDHRAVSGTVQLQ